MAAPRVRWINGQWQGFDGSWRPMGGGGGAGSQGPKGDTGAQGSPGADGATGPQGPPGADGAAGATGSQGIQGIQGATGATGPAGADGAAGAAGSQGIQGIQGVKGDTGDTGPAGADGANGTGVVGVKLTADLAAVTATALADATGLSFSLTANRYYAFRFYIRFQSAATTTGAQFAINAPANTFLNYRVRTSLTAAAAGAATERTARAVNVGTASASADAINSDLLATIEGVIKPTSNGTLIVRQATEVASSGITVKAGSCGILEDLGT
ncbi:MAG: hypothetical protein ACREXP_00095 [Steroidobacteraceae bacterium]